MYNAWLNTDADNKPTTMTIHFQVDGEGGLTLTSVDFNQNGSLPPVSVETGATARGRAGSRG